MANTTIITGASSGIGLELARVFAREGHNLVITARRDKRLKELKSDLESGFGVQVHTLPIDLAEPDGPEKLYEFTTQNKLPVDTLVNNAGVGDYGFFHESEWKKQRTIIDLNIQSLTHLTHLYLTDFVKLKRAYILNVASTAAFQPGPLMSIYYASKNYVLAFSEAIANELKDTGVSVTTLCPGPTETEFQQHANMEKSKLFDRFPVASSRDVAEYGYITMKKGKRVAIPGIMNKIAPKLLSPIPRNFVTALARKIQEKKP